MQTPKGKTLKACIGVTCAGILVPAVIQFEGIVLRGYRDPIGIVTKCVGDTQNAVLGQTYSLEECLGSLDARLIDFAEPVLKCTPVLKEKPYQLAAAISFAYNTGTSAYCSSTTARRFNLGDDSGACKALNESDSGRPQWVYARKGGELVTLPGLVKRRATERAMCERGLL